MKKLSFLLATMLIFFFAAAQQDIVVDPNATERPLQGTFKYIQVSDGVNLYLTQSNDEAIAVSAADERTRAGIKTEVKNGTLFIGFGGDAGWMKKNRKLKVYVSCKDLSGIKASGSCDVYILGKLTVTNLEIVMSGACDFKGAVYANQLKLNLSGASDINLSGAANNLNIVSSGASDVKSYGLVAEYCSAVVSGASDVQITVNKELTAHATGASDIRIKGNGVIKERQSSGSSSIVKVN